MTANHSFSTAGSLNCSHGTTPRPIHHPRQHQFQEGPARKRSAAESFPARRGHWAWPASDKGKNMIEWQCQNPYSTETMQPCHLLWPWQCLINWINCSTNSTWPSSVLGSWFGAHPQALAAYRSFPPWQGLALPPLGLAQVRWGMAPSSHLRLRLWRTAPSSHLRLRLWGMAPSSHLRLRLALPLGRWLMPPLGLGGLAWEEVLLTLWLSGQCPEGEAPPGGVEPPTFPES